MQILRLLPLLATFLVGAGLIGGAGKLWTDWVVIPGVRAEVTKTVTDKLTKEFEMAAAAARAAKEMEWRHLAREIEADQTAAQQAIEDDARAREEVLQMEIDHYEALCNDTAAGNCCSVTERDLDWWVRAQPQGPGSRRAAGSR